jgi:hypothetical protein
MRERIAENLETADVDLTDEEFSQIEDELAKIEIHGNRTTRTSRHCDISIDHTSRAAAVQSARLRSAPTSHQDPSDGGHRLVDLLAPS